jgi:hypothetical protein
MEKDGYTNFTALVDTERDRVRYVARKIEKLPEVSSVTVILAVGSPGTTLLTTGWLKGPIVEGTNKTMARFSKIKGILRNPDGSLKCAIYVAGQIFKWKILTLRAKSK